MCMYNRKCSFALWMAIITTQLGILGSISFAQSEKPTEEKLIADFTKLSSPQASATVGTGSYFSRHEQAIIAIDELLSRFPDTDAKTKALATKLRLLADLARFNPQGLQRLLTLTEEISKSNPGAALEEENRWYAIQAFVYGSRAEGMPGKQRLHGALERYRGFIKDFPISSRRPVAYGSMIRNLVLSDQLEEATKALRQFVKAYPDDPNIYSAQEEVLRPQLLGKPFNVLYTARDGRKISTKDEYRGKVLVIEYWSGRVKKSTDIWSDLFELLTLYGKQGLDFLGVSIDHDPVLMKRVFQYDMTPWPDCVEEKIVDIGGGKRLEILAVPCFIVLDKSGRVHDINHGIELREVVEELLGQ